MSSPTSTPPNPTFQKQRHIKYWLRCLKTVLPTAYTGNESQRMTLAFFTLSALDLLSALHTHTTPSEREDYINWIYRCQHPLGGFRGFTGADARAEMYDGEGAGVCWDPANLAATFFALAGLMVLGDGMGRVKRRECLEWMRGLQRGDGCFGEAKGKGGKVQGGGDVRHAYLATGIRWILRRGEEVEEVGDVDVQGLVGYVLRSVTYDGGIGQAPFHEPHAGFTYCGLGALKLLGRLPSDYQHRNGATPPQDTVSEDFVQGLLHWLVSRQTTFIQEDEQYSLEDDEAEDYQPEAFTPAFRVEGAYPVKALDIHVAADQSVEPSSEELFWVGFNGRCNKIADTCYAFWVGGSLGILNKVHLQDFNAVRRYLLDKTQHLIGGFGKLTGDPPDILHSYLGLATLATMREPELRSIDPTLCISLRAREEFEEREAVSLKEGRREA